MSNQAGGYTKQVDEPENPGTHYQSMSVEDPAPKVEEHHNPLARFVVWLGNLRLIPLILFLLLLPPLLYMMMEDANKGTETIAVTDLGKAIGHISRILSKEPIMNITSIQKGECPEPFDLLTTGTWPGTDPGCYCALTDTVTYGYCTKHSLCKNVSTISYQTLYGWKGAKMCGVRAVLNDDYMLDDDCTQYTDYMECYPGYCFKKTVGCPVTNVTIGTYKTDDSRKWGNNSNVWITLERETGKRPVATFDIEYNDIPCFDPLEMPNGQFIYPLISKVQNGCQRYGIDTNSSFKVDSDIEANVLHSNGMDWYLNKLPNYPDFANTLTMYLSARTKYSMKRNSNCIHIDGDSFAEQSENSSRIFETTMICSILAVFLWLADAIFLCIYIKEQHHFRYTLMIITFILGLVILLMSLVIFGSYNAFNRVKQYAASIVKHECFNDKQPVQVLHDLQDMALTSMEKIQGYNVILFPCSLVLCALWFLLEISYHRITGKI